MFKKASSLVTILAFVFFDWACISVYKIPVRAVATKDEIVGVAKTSGEYLQFSKTNPARVVGDRIVSSSSDFEEIDLNDVQGFRQNDKGVIYEVTTKDGRTFRDIEGKKEGEKIVIPSFNNGPSSILLSEVEFVQVRKINVILSLCVILGIVAGVVYGVANLYLANNGGIFGHWTLPPINVLR